MTCDRMKTLLVEMIYGDIDPRERAEAEEHVRRCGACSGEAESLLGVRRALDAGRPEVPPAAPLRVTVPPRAARGPLWAAAAAMAVAALLSTLALGRATVSVGELGFTLAFGAPTREAVLEEARLEAQAAARRVVEARLENALPAVRPIEEIRPYLRTELDAREHRILRRVSDRQAWWEKERERNLEQAYRDFVREAGLTRSLVEYALLASDDSQGAEH